MAATASFVRQLGAAVKQVAGKRGSSWYTPHMAAASRAIIERVPLVDLVLEVRDARVPLSSEYELLRSFPRSSRHIIVLNKMDLASRSQMKVWKAYFEQQNSISYEVNSHNKENVKEIGSHPNIYVLDTPGVFPPSIADAEVWKAYFEQQNSISYEVNSHNKENVKEFLNFLRARVRELKRTDDANPTITVMLVGIPNVGKSALANSLHQIGRISAAEKGKLKHATVSPMPGETKDISSFKIGSHPNIYVLDTPGVFPPSIADAEVCSKLALTGAIKDCLIGETELAQYFLAILNLSDEYKKWAKLSTAESDELSDDKVEPSGDSDVEQETEAAMPETTHSNIHDCFFTGFCSE
ncbi:P-loop containing nucleoside triphosphate hydrolases superfamily protein [Actinidia rufa]|uniref:P-loop containing nucleoside triphosphate hydrolases superfamily protein n=1 Tax=Actinidia rufa TaxID=165716 RepID=A0A7J0F0D2_9ERIC|nr:P-loop containing nucleoside triphosphate hydrolases superfamily protein [Actinidia rufa]